MRRRRVGERNSAARLTVVEAATTTTAVAEVAVVPAGILTQDVVRSERVDGRYWQEGGGLEREHQECRGEASQASCPLDRSW